MRPPIYMLDGTVLLDRQAHDARPHYHRFQLKTPHSEDGSNPKYDTPLADMFCTNSEEVPSVRIQVKAIGWKRVDWLEWELVCEPADPYVVSRAREDMAMGKWK